MTDLTPQQRFIASLLCRIDEKDERIKELDGINMRLERAYIKKCKEAECSDKRIVELEEMNVDAWEIVARQQEESAKRHTERNTLQARDDHDKRGGRIMKYHAEKFSLFCDCDWHVLDDDGCSVVERVRESFAREIVRALNRDELYAEMAELLEEDSSYLNGPRSRAKTLLTKIKVAEKGDE